jgi:predicted DsbA family dithiol-disulfide isomerase
VQLEELQDEVIQSHGDVKYELYIIPVIQVRGLDLEEVRRVLEQQLALVDLDIDGGSLKEIMMVVPLRRSMDRRQR